MRAQRPFAGQGDLQPCRRALALNFHDESRSLYRVSSRVVACRRVSSRVVACRRVSSRVVA
ncbi:hypothetical protein MTR01_18360, partial [Burkholderia thailandensis]|nr:hypothetical protein [Burkholderia thailandensis]